MSMLDNFTELDIIFILQDITWENFKSSSLYKAVDLEK